MTHTCALTHFGQVAALLVDLLVRLADLGGRLDPRDDGLNLELGERARESVIEGETVVRVDVATLGLLEQDLKLGARERLQRPRQIGGGDARARRDVLRRQPKRAWTPRTCKLSVSPGPSFSKRQSTTAP